MTSTLDLRQLAIDRSEKGAHRRGRRRNVLTRDVLPWAVLFGFAALLLWSARESLLPSKPVTVVPVFMMRAEVRESGTPMFQAAGWVEPRPSPVKVPALAEGVIERLLVVAGEAVEAGQPVAKLVEADARIALEDARADLQWQEAKLASAQAARAAARAHVERPVHLQAELAAAESALAKVQTDLATLPFAIRAAESRQKFARQDWEGKQNAGEALAARVVQRSQGEYESARAAVQELRARRTSREAEAETLGNQCQALRTRLELKIDETRRLAEAEAEVRSAEAKVRQAELAVQAAELRLERMTLRAPLSGRVLALNAQPGQRVSGRASENSTGGVLTLYNPRQLQIRADVRLEDVPHIRPGQGVRIESAALTEPLSGAVLTPTSLADIQKNTLQVTVAIDDPPAELTPEMLVRATFLSPQPAETEAESPQPPLRLLVPRPLVETGNGQTTVWLADRLAGRARKQTVVLGKAGTEQLVEVIEGLVPTDKLVAGGRETLRPGDRIRITGEASL